MLNIYICDDNPGDAGRIAEAVEKTVTIEAMDMALRAVTASPEEVLAAVEADRRPGAYFLDIDLKAEMTGLELAEGIRALDPRGFIVFVTTHAEMSYLTFVYKVEAMDFIIKRVGEPLEERVRACLLTMQERHTTAGPGVTAALTVKAEDSRIRLPFDELILIETAERHRIALYAERRQVTVYGALRDVLDQLDDRFYRCSSSAIVNRDKVLEVEEKSRKVTLSGGLTCYASTRMIKGILSKKGKDPPFFGGRG